VTLLSPKLTNSSGKFNVRERNGAIYKELLRINNTSHLASAIVDDNVKLVYPNSIFTVDLVTNSYKYGSELQFKAYSTFPPIRKARVDKEHNYYRLECGYLPVTTKTRDFFLQCAMEIDAVLKGVK